MTEIPPKPVCADQRGRLTCACPEYTEFDCIAARYFWLHIDQILQRATPEERNVYIDAVAKSDGEKRLLRRAARQEMAATQREAA